VTSPATDSERELASARDRGDPDALAEALAVHANALVNAGQLTRARTEIDEAAAIHRARGRVEDEARYATLAAKLSRLSGDLEGAKERASRVLSIVPAGSPSSVAATMELVDVALAQQQPVEAASLAERVLHSATTGLASAVRSGLLRKRAAALASVGRLDEAIGDLATALATLRENGEGAAARRTMVELATALQQRDAAAAERVRNEAMHDARAASDFAVVADLHLLEAAQAVARGDSEAAMTAAVQARDAALTGVSPAAYTSAATTISGLADARHDRVGAYEALAVGWATLRDLLGDGVARTAFEPKLLQLRTRWGASAFDDVKSQYEARRRSALGRAARDVT
jgi:tetratricopeptide (TPR) repeat protein